MSSRKSRRKHSSPTSHRTPHNKGPASTGEWEQLLEDPDLRMAYTRLSVTVQQAQARADAHAQTYGALAMKPEYIDLREATQLLDEHPQLVKFLSAVQQREDTRRTALSLSDMDIARAAPSLTNPHAMTVGSVASMGGWSGDKNKAQGVSNPRMLREWADRSTWVRIAIMKLRSWCERADIAVAPDDESRPFNRKVRQQIEDLLDQPNEYRDSYRSLIGPVIEDILVLDRGVIEKDMSLLRQPVHMYYQDGATIKIFPDWNGDPNVPRYLYDPGGGRQATVPLLNDEVIVIMKNITTWRYGYSPMQYLQDTIEADIGAMRSGTALVKNKPPMTMVQLKNASGPQLEAVRAKYDAEFAGQREIMFLGGPDDMKVAPLVFSAKDNQWLEWQIYLARKIATIFGISPQELGITFDVNRATAEVQYEDSQASGKIPLLLLLEEFLNRELLADFAPWGKSGRKNLAALNLKIIYPEVSEAARQAHAKAAVDMATQSLAGMPSQTINQVLALQGLEPLLHGGNTFYILTKDGPMPWLSYDNDYESLLPLQGEQNASGGIDESSIAADDTGESVDTSDTTSESAAAQQVGQNTAAAGASASSSPNAPGKATGGNAASSSSTGTKSSQPSSRSSWHDTRRPGMYWSPATTRQKSEREKVMAVQAATYTRPKEEVAARGELADVLRKVFGEVEERGSKAVKQYREEA